MIITKLIGGIGNQMFQYAVARRLAQNHHTDLKLDITSYESYKLREFELDHFNITAQISTKKEIEKFIKIPKNILEKIIFKLIPSLQKSQYYCEEKFYHFDPHILALPDNVYLAGYWQSEKYFKDIRSYLRKEITLKRKLNPQVKFLLDQIRKCHSVSLHVRRGDFVDIVKTKQLHGSYSLSYYQKAIEIIKQKIDNPSFFIFSDEPSWVDNNFKIDSPNINVSKVTNEASTDLILMSKCYHQIIVNSTFGWWGAWLNPNKSKIVITPKIWYQQGPCDTQDLLPDSWIKI